MQTAELVHFDAARHALALATKIDEVKQIRDKAEALRQYIRQQGASLEMQNQAAEIKLRAERRAGELLRETEKAQGGQPYQSTTDTMSGVEKLPETLKDLGITHKQSSRWQAAASVPEEKFEQYVTETKANKEELTSAGLYNIAKTGSPKVIHHTGNFKWYTPENIIQAARQAMGSIDCDPASCEEANEVVGAEVYYTEAQDGRQQDWFGNVWLNPPYSQPLVTEFCDLLVENYRAKKIKQACVLVNNATETGFFQNMLKHCTAVCFLRARVKFWGDNGSGSGPLQGQAVLYFGANAGDFSYAYNNLGVILHAKRAW